jgi:hypothetical protein
MCSVSAPLTGTVLSTGSYTSITTGTNTTVINNRCSLAITITVVITAGVIAVTDATPVKFCAAVRYTCTVCTAAVVAAADAALVIGYATAPDAVTTVTGGTVAITDAAVIFRGIVAAADTAIIKDITIRH